jgi:tetratricopeptide (TPR) repeat protein
MESSENVPARHDYPLVRAGIAIVAAAVLSGCAARGARFADRFVKPGEPSLTFDAGETAPPPESLADWGRRLRTLQANARPKSSMLPTLESQNADLAAALTSLALHDSAENHRRVAAAYWNVGVTDYAFRHYQRALKIEPCDSSSYENLARLWRDWGRPELALGDAHRAIHCRPHSASAHNTLGTVLLLLGQRGNARQAFELALMLDDRAVFALNNLCYVSLQEGKALAAQQACERALALDPTMAAAKTNLALAYAIQGDVAKAEQRLLNRPDIATGQYNVGILRMSLGKYADAADAFERALRARPTLSEAASRAVQARAFAAAYKEQ